MGLELAGIGTSAVFGGVDIGTDYIDESQGWIEPFKRTKDWVRVAGLVLGIVGDEDVGKFLPKDVSEGLIYSSIPMVERSAHDFVKGALAAHKEEEEGEWKLKKKGAVPTPGGEAGIPAIISY